MPTVYTPSTTKNPATYTIPADFTDLVTAASVNAPLTAVMDKAAYLAALTAPLPALNWQASSTLPTSANGIGAAWSDFEQAWYVTGTAALARSLDYARSWSAITDASFTPFSSASGKPFQSIAVSANGIVAALGNQSAAGGTIGVTGKPGAWTAVGSTPFNYNSAICYEATSQTFVGFLQSISPNSIRALRINQNAPTATLPSTLPITWSSPAGNPTVLCGAGGGTVVAVLVAATGQQAANIRTIRSQDGGVTWNSDQLFNVAGSYVASTPAWSSTDGQWYFWIGGFGPLQVFSSPDGATWTNVATLNSLSNIGTNGVVATVGSLILGPGYSINKGVNWYASATPPAGGSALVSGGSGFLSCSGTAAVGSLRFGLSPVQVT